MINWYPGHMTKAMRMMEENLRLVDAIVYVLDARAPFSCINPNFESMIGNKPVVYAFNKADLGDKKRVKDWVDYLSRPDRKCVTLNATASKSATPILGLLRSLCSAKIEKYQRKGVKTTIKSMVIGVPNTGKSTIINNLCGSAKTVTGNKAGVTRGKQWVRVNESLEVLDTPGTLYPKLSDQVVAKRLAYIGCINDDILDIRELACDLINELNALDAGLLSARYGARISGDTLGLESIAKSRGFLLKGGEVDVERASTALIDDFRKGKLGAVTLDDISEVK